MLVMTVKADTPHPLDNLQGNRLDGYTLTLGEIKQLRMSGWKGFTLYLQDSHGFLTTSPVVKGIFSIGGKDGVRPWMDLQYWEEVEFQTGRDPRISLSLAVTCLDLRLFKCLGAMIPAGGHLMVSYEDEQKIHNDTLRSLNRGIPPALTSLGRLLFMAGFHHIKNWYLSEGGFEGPRKLWAEKALTTTVARAYLESTAQHIEGFVQRNPGSDHSQLEEAALERSKEILEVIRGELCGLLKAKG